jgi:uncharacterized protein YyaL (SSP411 family)
MAQNLLHLGIMTDNEQWKKMAENMILSLGHLTRSEPNYMSNWAIAYLELKKNMAEVVIVGNDAETLREKFHKSFQPFSLIMGGAQESTLPLLEGKRPIAGRSTLYICFNKTCKAPVHTVEEAIGQLL